MTVDSHAHHTNKCYTKPFRYLTRNKSGYALSEGDREQLLQQAEQAFHIPLNRILVETDAPFILPYCKDTLLPKLLRRARNTSLLLPAAIEKIAELKAIPISQVERAAAENTIRLFSLPIEYH